MRLEWFIGSSIMSHCRIYGVICNNMIYRDVGSVLLELLALH